MGKILTAFVVVAVAVSAYFYFGHPGSRQVGEPALSATPTGLASPSAMASSSATPTPAPLVLKDGTYRLVPASSSMNWEGRKPLIPGYMDTGTVALKEGSVAVANGAVTSGKVVVDMATIVNVSNGLGKGMETEAKRLKSPDFFDVGTYPTSNFALTSFAPASASGQFAVSGTLTIKGITKPVTFPAMLSASGDALTLKAQVTLDRTLWGVKYGSGKFFQNLADKVIADTFSFSFTAVALLSK